MPKIPKTILAVDDERHIVRLVEVNLQRAGYQVVTAAVCEDREALEAAKQKAMLTQERAVMVVVSDLDRALAFYRDELGLQSVPSDPRGRTFDLDGVRLQVLSVRQAPDELRPRSGCLFPFP